MSCCIERTEILVIGCGLAGLNAAYEAASRGHEVTVIYKSNYAASPEIMGFNAPIHPEDSPDLFYNEITKSGEELNCPDLAKKLAEGALEQIGKLEKLGLKFAKNPDGTYNGMKALGNSYPRIAHYKALTGAQSMVLLKKSTQDMGVKFVPDTRALELISDGNEVYGCLAIQNENKLVVYESKCTILASGGLSNMHTVSTYPKGLVGDGYAMAAKAGAKLVDMEFTQFEPCCIVHPPKLWGKLIVTTMLSEGGKLLNAKGDEFLLSTENGYHVQKSELSRAIVKEIQSGGGTEHGGVWMDVTALPYERVAVDNSIFFDPPMQEGIDITKVPVEVAPAAHTFMGGVQINDKCETNLKGLLAAGEVSGGVHGANRLGGCAGTEVYVLGSIAGQQACIVAKSRAYSTEKFQAISEQLIDLYDTIKNGGTSSEENREILKKLKADIADSLGLYRNEKKLEEGLEKLNKYDALISDVGGEDFNLKITMENVILVARMQIIASLLRKESRGVFARTDYPMRDDTHWKKNIILVLSEGKIMASCEDVPQ